MGKPLLSAALLLVTTLVFVLAYKIDLGWPFKDQKHYGLLVYIDERRIVREVKIVD